jgi:hypothetical protein
MAERNPRLNPLPGDMLRRRGADLTVKLVDHETQHVSCEIRMRGTVERSAWVSLADFREGARRSKVIAMGVPR